MADPFLAEIRIFPFSFPPKNWAFCEGQLIPLTQNIALFSLLGTTYGGDGKSTFALPDLVGRAPMHPNTTPGIPIHPLGEMGGSETVTLLESEIPFHNHTVSMSTRPANLLTGTSASFGTGNDLYVSTLSPNPPSPPLVNMAFEALAPAGGDQPHNNMQPYLTFHFNIALLGVFPPRA